jgi:hypothetical protein
MILTVQNGLVKMNLLCNCDSRDLQIAIDLQQQEFEQQPPRNNQQPPSNSGSSRLVTGPQVKFVSSTLKKSIVFFLSTVHWMRSLLKHWF